MTKALPQRFSLSTFWQARTALTDSAVPEPGKRRTPWDGALNAAGWPIALWVFLELLILKALRGSLTDDFTTVHTAVRRFVLGQDVYSENYAFVDPHYLYSPGATLLLSPIGLIDSTAHTRLLFIALNAVCIVAAIGLLVWAFGWSLRSGAFPVLVAAAGLTEAVRNTLIFSNINGVLLLALVAFLVLHLFERNWWAGVVLGFAILIKPQFAPLLVLPLMRGRLQPLAGGIGVPVAINAIAWLTVPGAQGYLDVVTPYLAQVRDYANASVAGVAVYYGMPAWLHLTFYVLLAAAVLVAVVGLARWRDTDTLLWLFSSAGVLLVGVFLLSSLGQKYYSLFLFPLLLTVLLRRSVMHHWGVWLATCFFLTPTEVVLKAHHHVALLMNSLAAPVGWAMFLLATAVTVAVWWWLDARGQLATAEGVREARYALGGNDDKAGFSTHHRRAVARPSLH